MCQLLLKLYSTTTNADSRRQLNARVFKHGGSPHRRELMPSLSCLQKFSLNHSGLRALTKKLQCSKFDHLWSNSILEPKSTAVVSCSAPVSVSQPLLFHGQAMVRWHLCGTLLDTQSYTKPPVFRLGRSRATFLNELAPGELLELLMIFCFNQWAPFFDERVPFCTGRWSLTLSRSKLLTQSLLWFITVESLLWSQRMSLWLSLRRSWLGHGGHGASSI
jgi:hypothetical protein